MGWLSFRPSKGQRRLAVTRSSPPGSGWPLPPHRTVQQYSLYRIISRTIMKSTTSTKLSDVSCRGHLPPEGRNTAEGMGPRGSACQMLQLNDVI